MEIILGAVVSLLVQYLKNKFGTETPMTMLAVVVLSFVGAVAYVLVGNTDMWPTLLQIFTAAGAFYAYILQRFESK